MPGQLIPRGDHVWLVRVYQGRDPHTGKRIYSNKTIHGNKKDATTYLNGVVRDRDLGVYVGPADTTINVLLDGLLTDYSTNGKRVAWAELVTRVHLRPFFGVMKATQVGTEQIQEYIAARRKATTRTLQNGKKRKIEPASNATINRELSLLRRAFNIGKKSQPPKVSTVPPIPMLAENNARKGFFEDEAFLSMRQKLPEEIRPLITAAYYTGCRKGELLNLKWSQVDLLERVIRLEPGETKNDEARTVFMSPELYETLAFAKEIRDRHFPECDWVFSRVGKRIRDFRHSWDAACKAAGFTDRLFHDLRRTGVRNLVRAGVPEVVAMRISGHKTRAVFDRYNIVSESDLKDAARRQGEYVAQKRVPAVAPHTPGTQTTSQRVN